MRCSASSRGSWKPRAKAVRSRLPELERRRSQQSLVRRFFECIDAGDFGVLLDFYAPGFIDHAPTYPGLAEGTEGVGQAFTMSLAAFSDVRHVIDDQIASGDRVVTRMTASGTHIGDFRGIAGTGRSVSMEGIAIHRIADGKIRRALGPQRPPRVAAADGRRLASKAPGAGLRRLAGDALCSKP
ncbi:MAG: hypothetical protein GEU75_12780 [Dehalococcoidia bacterium]|nr:hypothetical protein [Dehalococcoidia bacterium]